MFLQYLHFPFISVAIPSCRRTTYAHCLGLFIIATRSLGNGYRYILDTLYIKGRNIANGNNLQYIPIRILFCRKDIWKFKYTRLEHTNISAQILEMIYHIWGVVFFFPSSKSPNFTHQVHFYLYFVNLSVSLMFPVHQGRNECGFLEHGSQIWFHFRALNSRTRNVLLKLSTGEINQKYK